MWCQGIIPNYIFSTQIVTDITGAVTQAVLYAPFGEVLSEYNAYWMLDTIPCSSEVVK